MTRKHLLAAIAVLMALLCVLPFAQAETRTSGSYEIELLDEDAKTVRIVKYTLSAINGNSENIEVVVPAELDGYTVKEIGDSAFINLRRLGRVSIPEGVTAIGAKAFSGCDGITNISLPSTLVSIGNKAFSNCKQLTKMVLPGGVTAIGENPFSLCDNLREIEFTGGSELFEVRDGMLIEKESSKLITYLQNSHGASFTLPGDIRTIGRIAFWECKELEEVILPEGLETIQESAFKSCTGIRSFTLPMSVHLIENRCFARP